MSRRAVASALVTAIALVSSSCGDGTSAGSGAGDVSVPAGFDAVIELEVVDGALVGGFREVRLDVGDHVRAVLTGDTDEKVHFHAYDLYIEPVDGEGELVFDAIIPGSFEVELEESGRLLIEMTVS